MRQQETDRSTATSPAMRRFARAPIEAPLLLVTDEARGADRVVNLSEGGLCVATDQPLLPGTVSEARLELPTAPGPLDLTVRVAWSDEDAMGLQILTPPAPVLAELRRALHPRSVIASARPLTP